MSSADTAALHGRFATDYDRLTQAYGCYAAEVLFGLAYERVRPGERLLDLGIGTGLSAAPFAQAGLLVSGVDVSPEMLAVCRQKNIAVDLRVADLTVRPWPYAPQSFEHILACGLLHFFGDLGPVLAEVARVVCPGGQFVFTVKAAPAGGPALARIEAQGLAIYLHSRAYVVQLAARHGFAVGNDMRFSVGPERAEADEVFYAFVLRRCLDAA
jgi:predicted TPR repeat methyltransferase